MKVLCALAQYQYGVRARGEDPSYVSFIPALRRLGHEVRHFETWDPTLYPTHAHLNHALLAEVEKYHPDIVLTLQLHYEIWTETLVAIQQMEEAALITWTTDDSFKFDMVSKYIGPFYDTISTTYYYRVADYRKAKIDGVFLTQWAANSFWLKPPKLARDCRYQVSFVGASYGIRAEVVQKLQAAGINVECFGHGWPNGSIPAEEIPKIMNDSVISLNFSAASMSEGGDNRQIKLRTFEVPGAGGFLLTDSAPGMNDVYQIGQEIEVYADYADLEQKIRYYLQHTEERDRIANAGYIRTASCHTWEHRLEGLLRYGLERRHMRLQRQVRTAPAAKDGAVETLPWPKLGVALRCLRWSLVWACSLVWGPLRGPKAARRLMFGASRRICGVKTFSAMSIPARMFNYV